jgi:hypothetical protein
MKRINEIYIEFHSWAMKSTGFKDDSEVIELIKSQGVKVSKWI